MFFIYEVLKCSKLPWQIVTELPYLLEGAGVVEKRGRSEVRADLPSKEIIIEESFNVSFGLVELPYLLEAAGVVEKRGRSEVRADLPSKEIIIEESFNVSFGLVGDLYLLHDFHPNWLLQKVFFFFCINNMCMQQINI